VASLSPAITATVTALGAGEVIVGRTHWCTSDAPVVGSLLEIDAEALVRARPCALLVQPPAQGIDATISEVSARIGAPIHAWPLTTLGDVRSLVRALPTVVAPGDAAVLGEAGRMLRDLDDACAPIAWDGSRTLLAVQAGDGRLASGPSTYVGEFIAACGIPNALPDGAWRTLDLEDMVFLDPAVILLMGSASTPWIDEVVARTGASVIAIDDDGLLVPSGMLGASLQRVRRGLERLEPAGSEAKR
jgi:ABC-type hemin transport system substrate-binding protein